MVSSGKTLVKRLLKTLVKQNNLVAKIMMKKTAKTLIVKNVLVKTQGLMISLITGGVAAIFQSVACIWGRQLAHSDYMIHVSHRTQNGNNFVGQREHVLADGSIVYVTNIGQLGTNQQRPQQGVPAERLASFRTKVLDEQAMQAGDWDTKGKNSTCVICLDDFQAGARVKTLPCGHLFHDACIDQWLHSNFEVEMQVRTSECTSKINYLNFDFMRQSS